VRVVNDVRQTEIRTTEPLVPESSSFQGEVAIEKLKRNKYIKTSKNIFCVIKYKRMGWEGHVAHMGERRGVYGFWWGNLRERDHLEDACVHGKIPFRWILGKWVGREWTGLMWLRTGRGGRHL